MGPWDPAVIGPLAGAVMVVAITAGVASVMIFRPLTARLGEFLEQMRQDRKLQTQGADPTRLAELMEGMLDRLERLEARQDFTERVIEGAGWKIEDMPSLSSRRRAQRSGHSSE